MAYRKYKVSLFLRVFILFILLTLLAFAIIILKDKTNISFFVLVITPILGFTFGSIYNLFKFITRRFSELDSFLESVKYKDFSILFNEKSGPKDIRELRTQFNGVLFAIKSINKEKEAQYLYLQKILELIDTGIMAYNVKTGAILWINDALKKILDIPSLKNILFIKKRKAKLYSILFETNHNNGNTVSIDTETNKIDVLISSSHFTIEDDTFKLIVLQNIGDTLNQSENEAWQKLLQVMTHEIMNSIAPISSLTETLQNKIGLSLEDPQKNKLDIDDLNLSINSIKRRSEGLMKFAKTYRGLNKITHLTLEKVSIGKLFGNIKSLLQPSLDNKNIEIQFIADDSEQQIEIDLHLIEQVLINLILNSVEAFEEKKNPRIIVSSKRTIDGHTTLKITDNGVGIVNEIKDKIFVPFFSTKKKGSGIGLSLCKQIMLLHKGKIHISSTQNIGTTTTLIFNKLQVK